MSAGHPEHPGGPDPWCVECNPELAPADVPEGVIFSRRYTSNSRGPGQKGTRVAILPPEAKPIDWSALPPACVHGIRGRRCESCARVVCVHPGVLPHACAQAEVQHG